MRGMIRLQVCECSPTTAWEHKTVTENDNFDRRPRFVNGLLNGLLKSLWIDMQTKIQDFQLHPGRHMTDFFDNGGTSDHFEFFRIFIH